MPRGISIPHPRQNPNRSHEESVRFHCNVKASNFSSASLQSVWKTSSRANDRHTDQYHLDCRKEDGRIPYPDGEACDGVVLELTGKEGQDEN
jgi:hypothetical protein